MEFKSILSIVSIGIILLLAINSGFTNCLYIDVETSSNNIFGAWTSTLWTQTTEADFSAGVLSDINVSASSGDAIADGCELSEIWYNDAWLYRKEIVLNNSGSALSDYQVKVDLAYDDQMQSDFDDIRFVDSDGITQLFCWLDDYNDSISATFWVRVPDIPSGGKTIYTYYGNDDALSASNGSQTFLFYDDFEEYDEGDVPRNWEIKDSNSSTWNLTDSSDYIYNSSKIEFEDGYAQLIGTSDPEWWDGDWRYRVYLDVNTSSHNRTDPVVTWNANFTSLLNNPDLTFDDNSIRVIEYDPIGNILGERTSQLIKENSYDASNNAVGDVIWILNGSTMSNTSRYYYAYFDTTTNPKNAAGYTNISINSDTDYADQNGVWYEISEKLHWKLHESKGGLYNDINWDNSSHTYSTTDHWEFGTNMRPAPDQEHMQPSFGSMTTDSPEVGPIKLKFYQHYSDGSYVETIYYKDQPWMKVIYHYYTSWNGNLWEIESVAEVGANANLVAWDSPDYQSAVMAGDLSSIIYNVNMSGAWHSEVLDDSSWHDNPSKYMSTLNQQDVEWYFIYKEPNVDTQAEAQPIIEEVITPVNVTQGAVSNPSYSNDAPSIQPVTGYSYDSICNFSSIQGPDNQGEIRYQISNDKISWYYHDGTDWVVSSGFAQTNSVEDVESSVGSLEDDIGPGIFYFKAFLSSDGTQQVQLDEISISRSTVEVRSDAGNKVLYDGNGVGGNVVAGNFSWTDIACRQMFRSIDGNISNAGLVVHYTNETREVYGGIISNTITQLWERNESASWADASGWNQIGGNWNISDVGTSWHMQELRVLNSTVDFYLDDVYIGNTTLDPDAPISGKTGFWSQYGEEGYRDEHIVRRYAFPEPVTVVGSKEYQYDEQWNFKKKITIDHTKVEADLTDFPVLINISSDSDLVAHAQADGDDILFTDTNNNKLSHEFEEFDGGTGKLISWVKVPELSSTTDTEIYMRYGNPTCESQENASGVWDDNFQMVQHMEETSGSHADSTVLGNDLTPQGSIDQNAVGIIGGANYYDGIDDYLSRTDAILNGDIPAKSTGSANYFTLSAWVKLTGSSERYPLIVKQGDWDTNMDRGFLVGATSSYYLESEVFRGNDGTNDKSELSSTQALSADQWYYVTYTYDYVTDGTSKMYIYLNGVQNGSNELAYGPPIENTRDLYIGHYYWSGSYNKYFKGNIDEVRISNTVRSEGWIKTSYNNQYSSSTFYDIGSEEGECPVTTGTIASQILESGHENYNKKITIDHTKVDGELTDFPVLISLSTDADLAAHTQSDGDDIFFTAADDTRLSHEIEEYNSSTGELIAWVKIPTLSNTTDTDIYMQYGDQSCGSQENAADVWDSNFLMVQHLNNLNSTTTEDSTSNNYDGTKTAVDEPLEVDGMIGNAQYFDGSNDHVNVGVMNHNIGYGNYTWSVWAKTPDAYNNINPIMTNGNYAPAIYTKTYQHTEWGTYYESYRRTGTVLSLNTWYHLVVQREDGIVRFYQDGVLLPINHSFVFSMANSEFYIGRSGAGWYGRNTVDEARVSNTVRSESWVKTSYNNQFSPSTFYSVGPENYQINIDGLFWDETLASGTDISFDIRASDTLFLKDDAAPSWTSIGGTSPVTSGLPSGKYVQWRATLTCAEGKTPILHEVRLYYHS